MPLDCLSAKNVKQLDLVEHFHTFFIDSNLYPQVENVFTIYCKLLTHSVASRHERLSRARSHELADPKQSGGGLTLTAMTWPVFLKRTLKTCPQVPLPISPSLIRSVTSAGCRCEQRKQIIVTARRQIQASQRVRSQRARYIQSLVESWQ